MEMEYITLQRDREKFQEGRVEAKKEAAKALLDLLDDETIASRIGLTLEEIKALREEQCENGGQNHKGSPPLSGDTIVIISIESSYTMIFYKSLDYVFLHIQAFCFIRVCEKISVDNFLL